MRQYGWRGLMHSSENTRIDLAILISETEPRSSASTSPRGAALTAEPPALIVGVARRHLGGDSRLHENRLRGNPKLSRHFQWAPDIRVFRAVIEDNQLHAMRTLHLIAMLEFDGPLGKGLAAFGAYARNSIGHETLLQPTLAHPIATITPCWEHSRR
jgi:hypothetical protein